MDSYVKSQIDLSRLYIYKFLVLSSKFLVLI